MRLRGKNLVPKAAKAIRLSENTRDFRLNIAFKALFAQALGVAVANSLEAPAVVKKPVFIGPGQSVVIDIGLPLLFNSSFTAVERLST